MNKDYLVHIAEEFASNIFATSLFVVKDTRGGGLKGMSDNYLERERESYQDNDSETTSRK